MRRSLPQSGPVATSSWGSLSGTVAASGGIDDLGYLPLRETVSRFEAARLALVTVIASSADDWDTYESLHWRALEEWLAANPEDPDAPMIRARYEHHRDEYLRFQRALLGWAIFAARKPDDALRERERERDGGRVGPNAGWTAGSRRRAGAPSGSRCARERPPAGKERAEAGRLEQMTAAYLRPVELELREDGARLGIRADGGLRYSAMSQSRKASNRSAAGKTLRTTSCGATVPFQRFSWSRNATS